MEPREYERTAEAEEHHWWFRELRAILGGLLARTTREDGIPGPILDAGCGTGGNLRTLLHDHEAVGLDLSPLALSLARTRTAVPLVRGSVEALPFREGSFGLILCADVLYHRGVEDDLAALREIHRVLRPGGWLLLNVPAFETLRSAHDRAMHTARRYRRGTIEASLERAGLRPERIVYWNGLLLAPAALLRLLRRHRATGSEIGALPQPLDRFLGGIARLDAALALHGLLPAGLSIAVLAERAC